MHGSKGLEADCIVLPGLKRGTYGFPSEIADDPLLDLVMAEPASPRDFRLQRNVGCSMSRSPALVKKSC